MSRLTNTQHLIHSSVRRLTELLRDAAYFECVIEDSAVAVQCSTVYACLYCAKLCVILYIAISNTLRKEYKIVGLHFSSVSIIICDCEE